MTLTEISVSQRPPLTRPRVRWRMYFFLFMFGMIAYLQARSIPVAGVKMMSTLGLTPLELSYIETAFLVGYTLMQFPGGLLGQYLGARRTFVVIGLIAFAAALATPLAPYVLTAGALYATLLAAQFVLGAAQGPIFPVSAGVFEAWFTPDRWPLVQGVQSMALGIGAALAPYLVTPLMVNFDWQRALIWTTLPALVFIIWWGLYARNTPAEHPRVSEPELSELGPQATTTAELGVEWPRVRALLGSRDVLLLTVSYFCMNYVYYLLANWCFFYLLQERHFTTLETGNLASLPPLAAAVGAGAGGYLATVLARRFGVRAGLRLLPLLSLPAAGLMQFVAVDAFNAYLAVAALALCFFFVELNEGPYWAAMMQVARADAMAATGILNTGGNLAGIIATPIIGYLVAHHQWTVAFLLGTGMAVASGAAWFLIDPTRRIAGAEPRTA